MKNYQFILLCLLFMGGGFALYGERPDSILIYSSEKVDQQSCEAVAEADFIFEGIALNQGYRYQAVDVSLKSKPEQMNTYGVLSILVTHVYKGDVSMDTVYLICDLRLSGATHSPNIGGVGRPFIYFGKKNVFPLDSMISKKDLFFNVYPALQSGITIDPRTSVTPGGLYGTVFNNIAEVYHWLQQCGGKDQINVPSLPKGLKKVSPSWTKEVIEEWGILPSRTDDSLAKKKAIKRKKRCCFRKSKQ